MDPLLAAGAGLFILAMGEVPNYYSGVLPSWMTIRRFAADERDSSTLRIGMVAASVFALGIGVGASLLAHSPWPLVGTVIGATFLVVGYEWAIRHPHSDAQPINAPSNTGRSDSSPLLQVVK
ncbi:MAG: hypothetical protein ACYCV4_02480 [Dermatophilaceae bacterium]